MSVKTTLLVAALCLLARPGVSTAQAPGEGAQPGGPAAATDAEAALDVKIDGERLALLREIAARGFRRARRAWVLGPLLGAGGGVSMGGDAEAIASLGLGVLHFDLPVIPNAESLKAAMLSRFRARLEAEARASLRGREHLSEAELAELSAEIWAAIRSELLMELTAKRFEPPGAKFLIEAVHQFSTGAWELRTVAALGVSKVYLGSGAVLLIDDGADLVIPLELSVPVTLSTGLRSPTLDLFLRYDYAVTGRDAIDDKLLLGARWFLDLI